MVKRTACIRQGYVPAWLTIVEALTAQAIAHQVVEAMSFADKLLSTLLEDAVERQVTGGNTLGRVSTLDDDIEVAERLRCIADLASAALR